jgi:hypothetical protein
MSEAKEVDIVKSLSFMGTLEKTCMALIVSCLHATGDADIRILKSRASLN